MIFFIIFCVLLHLRTIIFSRVSDLQIQNLLDSIIFQTLGTDLENSFDCYFDYQLALDEIRFFESNLIPRIKLESIPPEISNVKFSCDLSRLLCQTKYELSLSQSNLFRSL